MFAFVAELAHFFVLSSSFLALYGRARLLALNGRRDVNGSFGRARFLLGLLARTGLLTEDGVPRRLLASASDKGVLGRDKGVLGRNKGLLGSGSGPARGLMKLSASPV